MVAELSILTRYPCGIDDCQLTFRMKADRDIHKRSVHRKKSLPVQASRNETRDEIKCTYATCNNYFPTHQEMIFHKTNCAEHDYCKTCDIDCADWDDFARHKIGSEKHICCPICAIDFGSAGGMERHVKMAHRKTQNLVCSGCDTVYPSAGALIGHLEVGNCRRANPQTGVSQDEFRERLDHKQITEHISRAQQSEDDSAHFFDGETTAPISLPGVEKRSYGEEFPAVGDQDETGGVSLGMTHPQIESLGSRLAISAAETGTKSAQGIPSRSYAQLGDKRGIWGTSASAQTLYSTATQSSKTNPSSFKEALKHLDEEYTATISKTTKNEADTVDGTTPTAHWDPLLKKNPIDSNASVTAKSTINLNSKFWHPDDPNYDPDAFYIASQKAYHCPFDGCVFQTEIASKLAEHMGSDMHVSRRHTCPGCGRVYKNATALMQHCDSSSVRCRIRHHSGYAKVVDRISGGFVSVQANGSIRGKKGSKLEDVDEEDEGVVQGPVNDPEKLVEHIRRFEPRYEVGKVEQFW